MRKNLSGNIDQDKRLPYERPYERLYERPYERLYERTYERRHYEMFYGRRNDERIHDKINQYERRKDDDHVFGINSCWNNEFDNNIIDNNMFDVDIIDDEIIDNKIIDNNTIDNNIIDNNIIDNNIIDEPHSTNNNTFVNEASKEDLYLKYRISTKNEEFITALKGKEIQMNKNNEIIDYFEKTPKPSYYSIMNVGVEKIKQSIKNMFETFVITMKFNNGVKDKYFCIICGKFLGRNYKNEKNNDGEVGHYKIHHKNIVLGFDYYSILMNLCYEIFRYLQELIIDIAINKLSFKKVVLQNFIFGFKHCYISNMNLSFLKLKYPLLKQINFEMRNTFFEIITKNKPKDELISSDININKLLDETPIVFAINVAKLLVKGDYQRVI